jgi:hypothetical protein
MVPRFQSGGRADVLFFAPTKTSGMTSLYPDALVPRPSTRSRNERITDEASAEYFQSVMSYLDPLKGAYCSQFRFRVSNAQTKDTNLLLRFAQLLAAPVH